MFEIMGHDWQIKLTTEPIGGDVESRAFLGQGDESTNIIFIDGTMPESRQQEVFLHEITHQVTTGFPEMMVNELGRGLFAAFKANGLMPDDFLSRFVDGDATPEEVQRLNDQSQAIMDQPEMMFFRVNEGAWDGPVFDEAGNLTIRGADGKVNRTAAHIAAAKMVGAQGGHALSKADIKQAARELVKVYDDELKEMLYSGIVRIAGR